jgi:hypothetical protein
MIQVIINNLSASRIYSAHNWPLSLASVVYSLI